jgi:hypothetical protein
VPQSPGQCRFSVSPNQKSKIKNRKFSSSAQQKRKGAGQEDGMYPNGKDLDFAVGAGTAVFAGDIGIHAEEALVVFEEVDASEQRRDEEAREDYAEKEQYFVLHCPRLAD